MPLSFAVLSFLAVDPAPQPNCAAELFRIERSKNANVVLYEAKPGHPGTLDADEPITASWLMLAAKGERQSLNFIERSLAYGFEVKPAPSGGFAMVLKALRQRVIHIATRAGCTAAMSTIDGREGVLQRVFVKADDRAVIPPVQYVELFGIDAATGAPLHEKLVP